MWNDIAQDVRYGLRSFRSRAGLSALIIATLALCIGANTAIFSVLYGILVRPLPYGDADRIVAVYESSERAPRFAVAPANYLDWREEGTVFEAMAAYAGGSTTLLGAGEPQRIDGVRVSRDYFRVLGVQPALGRAFLPEEDAADGPAVVILSHGLWATRFGADPGVIGRTVRLGERAHTVIGVMPRSFSVLRDWWAAEPIQIWRPHAFEDNPPGERRAKRLRVLARLAPGATVEQAQAQLDAIAGRLAVAYPESNEGWGVRVLPLRESLVSDARLQLLVLGGAVLFVLLIGCLNVANLLLARASSRGGELAVRAAVGASRSRLVRQLMTESALFALLGAALGLGLARVLTPLLVAASPSGIPRLHEVRVDTAALVFTLAAAALTALLFGTVPALRGSRTEPVHDLKAGGGTGAGGAVRKDTTLLTVVEVGLAFVLLVGAGLMLNSFGRINQVELGFDAANRTALTVRLPRSRYAREGGQGALPETRNFKRWTPEATEAAFVRGVLDRLRAVPGVARAAVTNGLPTTGRYWGSPLRAEGAPEPEPDDVRYAMWRAVSRDYFQAMAMPLLEGRLFSAADTERRDVTVLSRAAARMLWPDAAAIGRRVVARDGVEDLERSFEVVGVVEDVKQAGLGNLEALVEKDPIMYVPLGAQATAYTDWQIGFRMNKSFVVESTLDPDRLYPALREAVWAVDPDLPILSLGSLDSLTGDSLAQHRFYTGLLLGFALLAVVLAATGIYGVTAFGVSRRTREIGIRMALGADRRRVLSMVLRRGAILAGSGIVIGVAVALALTRFLDAFLFGIGRADPATYGAVALVLFALACLACLVPARRAARIDPATAIRYE